jgi:N-acetylmuramic acid 6-phosphate etherase
MAKFGVSVFLGGAEVPVRLPGYLKAVAERGGTEIFTSLHIPEVPFEAAVGQLADLTAAARAHGMAVVADIAPGALAKLGATPSDLSAVARLGLAGVRLDYGFGPEAIAQFAQNKLGLRIQLNASTIEPTFLAQTMAAGADPALLEVCHNYYPRPETGISWAHFTETSRLCLGYGLRVAAFVPGSGERRGPLHLGLPTVEVHRNRPGGEAAAELFATGLVDAVLMGDPWATETELEALAAGAAGVTAPRAGGVALGDIRAGTADGGAILPTQPIQLRVQIAHGISDLEEQILRMDQSNRPDLSDLVIRSTASRAYAARGAGVLPRPTGPRPRGTVTIDNTGYLRYQGELQITRQDLPLDTRVNLVASVIPEDLHLLDQIGIETRFKLVPVAGNRRESSPMADIKTIEKLVSESRNQATMNIDEMSTLEMARVMNEEDQKVALAVQACVPQIAEAVDIITAALQKGGRLFYTGAGTSGRLGVLDASECPPTYGVSPELVQGIIAGGYPALVKSSESTEDSKEEGRKDCIAAGLRAGDVLVGLAASGRTPYASAGLEYAKEIGARAIAVTCNPASEMATVAELTIAPVVGPEVVTGSTRLKSGTAQKLVLNMLSTLTMIKLGKTYGNLMVDVQPTNAKLVERAKKIIMEAAEVSYERAAEALAESEGQVKVASVIALTGAPAAAAREALAQGDGFVKRAVRILKSK